MHILGPWTPPCMFFSIWWKQFWNIIELQNSLDWKDLQDHPIPTPLPVTPSTRQGSSNLTLNTSRDVATWGIWRSSVHLHLTWLSCQCLHRLNFHLELVCHTICLTILIVEEFHTCIFVFGNWLEWENSTAGKIFKPVSWCIMGVPNGLESLDCRDIKYMKVFSWS